jgi:hypothetical protein
MIELKPMMKWLDLLIRISFKYEIYNRDKLIKFNEYLIICDILKGDYE